MPVPSRLSLYKRRSNQICYIGYYQDGRRHWKSTGVSTRPEALKALTQFRELLQERLSSAGTVRATPSRDSLPGTEYPYTRFKVFWVTPVPA